MPIIFAVLFYFPTSYFYYKFSRFRLNFNTIIGEFKDFNDLKSNSSGGPMTNDVRSVKSAAKSTSSTLWHPISSLVEPGEDNMESVSSTAVMVQPVSRTPSRNVSTTSFHSGTGPIVVAPVESIKFVPSSTEKPEQADGSGGAEDAPPQ